MLKKTELFTKFRIQHIIKPSSHFHLNCHYHYTTLQKENNSGPRIFLSSLTLCVHVNIYLNCKSQMWTFMKCYGIMELQILCFSIIYLLFIFIFSYIFDINIHPIYLSKISIENLIYFFFPKQLHTMIKFSLVFKLLLILHFVYYT